ncbi:MAG: hypothetical protein H0V44_07470 [Planctomycetes bacterium]|nr:hypothetical protein [Planctomycetota bacterium]
MISSGALVRIAILATWIGLFGFHVASRIWAGRGAERRLSLETSTGRPLRYDITMRTADIERPIGTCLITRERSPRGYRISTRVSLADASSVPVLDQLLSRLGTGDPGERATLRIVEEFDELPSISCISMSASAGTLAAEARFDLGPGLHGRWQLDGGPEGRLDFPSFPTEGLHGLQLVPVLPADLVVGDRFAEDTLGVDPLAAAPIRHRSVYVVASEETLEVGGQTMILLRVEVASDGVPCVQLWCDRTGTIHVMRARDIGLSLSLRRSHDADSDADAWSAP